MILPTAEEYDEEVWRNLMGHRTYERSKVKLQRVREFGGLRAGWNWPAFIFAELWLFYRGYYPLLFSMVLSTLVVFELGRAWLEPVHLLSAYVLVSRVLLPMYVDSYIGWTVRGTIRRIVSRQGDPRSTEFACIEAPIFERRPNNLN